MCPNRLGNHKVTKPAFNVRPLSAPFGKVRHNHGSGVWRSISRGTMYQNAHFVRRCNRLSCPPPPLDSLLPGGKLSRDILPPHPGYLHPQGASCINCKHNSRQFQLCSLSHCSVCLVAGVGASCPGQFILPPPTWTLK